MNSTAPSSGSVLQRMAALEQLSRAALEGGFFIASEGDRWTLGLLLGARGIGRRLASGLGGLRRRVDATLGRGPQARRAKAHRRLRRLLRQEASRTRLDIPPAQLEVFAAKLSLLLDLVLDGEIEIDAIGFERVEPSPGPAEFPGAVFASMDQPFVEA
jgi:hypothetical protein